jgi:hypothetical protein
LHLFFKVLTFTSRPDSLGIYIYIYVLQELNPGSPVASFCVRLCCFLLIWIVKFLIWCVHLFEREIFELKLDDVGGWVTIILLMCVVCTFDVYDDAHGIKDYRRWWV